MRILVDGHAALQGPSRLRGIGRSARGLLKSMLNCAGDHEIILSLCADDSQSIEAVKSAFADLIAPEKIIVQRIFSNVKWEEPQNVWRREVSQLQRNFFHALQRPDVVLSFSAVEGFDHNVITQSAARDRNYVEAFIFHDLIPLLNPAQWNITGKRKEWYDAKIEIIKNSDLLLGVSDSAIAEAIGHIGRSAENSISISSACDEFFKPLDEADPAIAAVKARLGIFKPFFFSLGPYESRKNFDRLVKAQGKVADIYQNQFQFVLGVAPVESDRRQLDGMIKEAGLTQDDVIITGSLDDCELRALYNACYAFVFPSLHEGFGLPPLEAMQCGAVAIGSDKTSLPEVFGAPEAMFCPESVDSIANAMSRLVIDKEHYAHLKRNAAERAAKFSWSRTAERALDAMQEALEKKRAANKFSKHPSRSAAYRALIRDIGRLECATVSPGPSELAVLANHIAENTDAASIAVGVNHSPSDKINLAWRFEGPFDSTYSLALVNREILRVLAGWGEPVTAFCTEGHGNYEPNREFIEKAHPDILTYLTYEDTAPPSSKMQIVARNLYPPRVADMGGDLNILHQYAWEESLYPQPWVEALNLHLDGVLCVSEHVKKVLEDSGVFIPLAVTGNGTDHWEKIRANPNFAPPGKKFKFLHVSACLPRKGADVLLNAYGAAFRSSDDVSLIIKSFDNEHNHVRENLEALRAKNPEYPDTHLIFDDLSNEDLKALYEASHAVVAPSRAEGFGLPFAEAMLSGIPVITTGWSGQLDFCNDDTAWLIDYDYAYARTHFEQFASVWAEPRVEDLSRLMREVYEAPQKAIDRKVAAARELISQQFHWRHVAERLDKSVRGWIEKPVRKAAPKIGWVTTWNTKCGIATYSQHLLERFPAETIIYAPYNEEFLEKDGENVRRVWEKATGGPLSVLEAKIYEDRIEVLVIHLNYGFVRFDLLNQFLQRMKENAVSVFLFMHSTVDPHKDAENRLAMLVDGIKSCARILVHSPHDMNRLKALDVVDNVVLFPHGALEGGPVDFTMKDEKILTISSYGFCMPHKGLEELILAFDSLVRKDPNLRLHLVNALYPEQFSADFHASLVSKAQTLSSGGKIRFTPDFLSDEKSLAYLRASDIIVFPYQQTGESASGAVRVGLSSGRPIATTPLSIFDDVRQATFSLPGTGAAEVAQGLEQIIKALREQSPEVEAKADIMRRWREEHSYRSLARRLFGMIRSVYQSAACP